MESNVKCESKDCPLRHDCFRQVFPKNIVIRVKYLSPPEDAKDGNCEDYIEV